MAPSPHITGLLNATLAQHRDRPALAHGASTLTYGELARRADRLAASLAVRPGDRVAIVSRNVPGLVVSLWAAWQAGAVAVPLSDRLGRFELERAFRDCQPRAAVWIGAAAARDRQALLLVSACAALTLDEGGELTAAQAGNPSAGGDAAPVEDAAAILYTSGTTGEPKGALVPQALAEAEARELAGLLGASASLACGFVVPIPHAFGLACLLACLAAGGLVVLVEHGVSLEPLVAALRLHDAAVLHGTPSLFARLLTLDPDLALETGFTAGAACPAEVFAALDRRGMRLLNLYGMTEIGAAAACRRDDPPEIRHHTVGRALADYELRIREGEIQVRGPFAREYHRRTWTAAESAGDGWFRTGDLGSLDRDGNLTIAGRAKEVVQVAGFSVFPAEVETYLLTHPAIAAAVVVGAQHPTMGQALRAFVVAGRGAMLEPRDVIAFARAGIAGYKVPYDVRVVDELPLLASGKPDRRALELAAHTTPAAAA